MSLVNWCRRSAARRRALCQSKCPRSRRRSLKFAELTGPAHAHALRQAPDLVVELVASCEPNGKGKKKKQRRSKHSRIAPIQYFSSNSECLSLVLTDSGLNLISMIAAVLKRPIDAKCCCGLVSSSNCSTDRCTSACRSAPARRVASHACVRAPPWHCVNPLIVLLAEMKNGTIQFVL